MSDEEEEASPRRRAKLAPLVGELDTTKDVAQIWTVLKVLLRLRLQSSQKLRVLRSIIFQVLMGSQTSAMVVAIKDATKKYTEAAERCQDAEARQEALGSPHIHAWNAILKYSEENSGDECKAAVQEYLKITLQRTTTQGRRWTCMRST